MKFKRHIGVGGMLFASISAVVGSGWLFSPMYAAQVAGPASLLSWGIAGICMLVIGLTFAELGALFPIAGGVANYPYFTHGRFAGFLLGWISWMSFVVISPIEVQAAIQYGSNFFPTLYEKDGITQSLTKTGYLTATVLMLILVFINSRGIKAMTETNKVFSIWKIIVPTIAIVALIYHAPNGFTNLSLPAAGGFMPYGWHGVLSALVAAGVVFSFNGFQMGILMAAETKNPQKNIPISILGSILFCFILYAFLQIAFLVAIPQTTLLEYGWDHLRFIGDAGPFAGLAIMLGLVWVASLLYIDAIVAPFGAGLVYVASTARLLYAFGKNGYLPPGVSKLNHKGIPFVSMWINFFVGMLMFLPFPGWQSMVTFLSSAIIATYMAIPICLVTLRQNAPEITRPFKLPYYKIISFLAFYIANMMLFWSGWNVISKLLLCIIIGTAIYFTYMFYKKDFQSFKADLKNGLWLFAFFGGISVISKLGSYGGGTATLTLGYDFLVVAIFSGLVMAIAQKFKLTPQESRENIDEIIAHSKAATQ